MAEINAAQLIACAKKTGAGMMECERPSPSRSNEERAIEILRERGWHRPEEEAACRGGRGRSYIHMGGKWGIGRSKL